MEIGYKIDNGDKMLQAINWPKKSHSVLKIL